MARFFWIIGFSISVLMFGLFTVVSVAALIKFRFMSLGGWTGLIAFGSSTFFMFGRLRAAIRHGDPTADLGEGTPSTGSGDPETRSR